MTTSVIFHFPRIGRFKEPRSWSHLAEPLDYIHLLFPFTTFILDQSKQVIPSNMPFAVKALDHVVLTCRNIPATVKFYNGLLGMKHEVFRSSKDAPGVERYVYFLVRESSSNRSLVLNPLHDLHQYGPMTNIPLYPRHALSFGTQKLNLHQAGSEFEPKASLAKPGTADLCFITTTPITDVLAELKQQGLEILEDGKVVDRTGAVGNLKSVYTRDPDGNLIEVANYV
jgi:catechol 2,3-dioxygenase-like lactoylglutathione lyase family enzyme